VTGQQGQAGRVLLGFKKTVKKTTKSVTKGTKDAVKSTEDVAKKAASDLGKVGKKAYDDTAKAMKKAVGETKKAFDSAVKWTADECEDLISDTEDAFTYCMSFLCAGGSYSFTMTEVTGLDTVQIDSIVLSNSTYSNGTYTFTGTLAASASSLAASGELEASADAVGISVSAGTAWSISGAKITVEAPFTITVTDCLAVGMSISSDGASLDMSTIDISMSGVDDTATALLSSLLTTVEYYHGDEISDAVMPALVSITNSELDSLVSDMPSLC